jgi:hypothetical protein
VIATGTNQLPLATIALLSVLAGLAIQGQLIEAIKEAGSIPEDPLLQGLEFGQVSLGALRRSDCGRF